MIDRHQINPMLYVKYYYEICFLFRLDRLGNLQSLINILQRERTQISEDLDTQQILSGNLEQTLKLVWIIIVRLVSTTLSNFFPWDRGGRRGGGGG